MEPRTLAISWLGPGGRRVKSCLPDHTKDQRFAGLSAFEGVLENPDGERHGEHPTREWFERSIAHL